MTEKQEITIKSIKESLELSKDFLNTLNVSGVDNYQKIIAIHNNMQAIITLINNGMLVTNNSSDEDEAEEK